MSTSENESNIYYNLSPEFRDLIQTVKNEGKKVTTPKEIIQLYNGSKRRGNKLTEDIELIFEVIGIKTESLLYEYGIEEQIELVKTKSSLPLKFRKIIDDTKNKGEITTTPRKLMEAYSDSHVRTVKKNKNIKKIFSLYGINADNFEDCKPDDDIKLSREENIDESIIEVSEEEPTISNEIGSSQGEMKVSTNIPDNIQPNLYQSKAMRELTYKMGIKIDKSVAGILVLPTGAGKTLTAARWLLNNAVDKNIKVLWLAHRHELIEQAANTFAKNAGIVKSKKGIIIRKLSGLKIHDRSRHISGEEDVIIASVQTLARNETNLKYLKKFLQNNKNEKIFLVIDEAHHSIAKTYRKIITHLKSFKHLRIIGLTATPFRTLEKEMGGLSKIFGDGIIYSEDLQKLISQEYLAKPIHNSVPTNFDIEREIEFDDKDKKFIEQFKELPEKIITSLAKNATRRKCVVDTYLNKRDVWGKTIIFALNQHDAIAINDLLYRNNIKSDYVISGLIQRNLQLVSNIENEKKIEKFRIGNLDVLVNVNILTEGFDSPNIQTVFLTRPTKSKTMMTQMVGRGLRGPKMGGTKTVNLVSFVDNWENLVGWITPKELLPPSEIGDPKVSDYERKIPYFIPEKLIQDYARMLYDETGETDDLKNLKFIQRIPIGWYGFELIHLSRNDDSENDNSETDYEQDSTPIYVLVYENQKLAYEEYIRNLTEYKNILYDSDGIGLSEKDLEKIRETSEDISNKYFNNCSSPIPIHENIQNILRYHIQSGNTPKYYTFEERDKFDISKIANHVIEKGFDRIRERDYLKEQFENPMWKQLFGNNYEAFKKDYELSLDIILNPEKHQVKSNVYYEQKNPEEISDIPLELRWKVLERDGHKCVKPGCGSKKYLQIDHIRPFSIGGETVLENLQTLCKKHNAEKGETEISYI